MLGDVITSTPLKGERRFRSPSLGEIVMSPLFDVGHAPSGFSQKIVPISKNLCIAWSGHHMGARGLSKDLRAHFRNSEVTFVEVNEFLESLQYKEAREVSLVGICASDDKVEIFGVRCKENTNHPLFGHVYVAGSGFNHFELALDAYQSTKELETSNPVLVAGGLGAAFLTLEAFTGAPLKQAYGGGFEILRFENGECQRLPEATYVFWRGREDNNHVTYQMHPTVVKICYKEENLIIRRSSGVSDQNVRRPAKATNSLLTIPSFLGSPRTKSEENDDLPNLNSAFTFHGFFIERGPHYILTGYGENERQSIEFREDQGTIRCSLSEAFRERVDAMVKRFITS
jgi:hypothetical protein